MAEMEFRPFALICLKKNGAVHQLLEQVKHAIVLTIFKDTRLLILIDPRATVTALTIIGNMVACCLLLYCRVYLFRNISWYFGYLF